MSDQQSPLDSVLECFDQPVLASLADRSGSDRFVACNQAARDVFAYSKEQFLRLGLGEIIMPSPNAEPGQPEPAGQPLALQQVNVIGGLGHRLYMNLRQFSLPVDGRQYLLHAFSAANPSDCPQLDGATGSQVFSQSLTGMAVCDMGGTVMNANRSFRAHFGLEQDNLRGKHLPSLLGATLSNGVWDSICREIENKHAWEGWLRPLSDKGPLTITASAQSLFDNNGRHGLILLETRQELAEEEKLKQLQLLSHRDHLTGLPNRTLFNDRLQVASALARRRGTGLAILFLDLDNFKTINDSLGHTLGDKLLRRVGERLLDCVRDEDTVSRPGGDEFLVVLQDISSVGEASDACRRILRAISSPMFIDRHELYVSASVGITLFPDDGEDPETLVRNADMAMFAAKEQGKNNFQHYTPSLNTRVNRRLVMENSLRKGFERREFLVYYQPQIDFQTGQVVGMEALARWNRPELGLVGAHEFIPLAEETGLIVPIGEYMLYQSCLFAKRCHQAGHQGLTVSVNFSARQLLWQHDAVDMLESVLSEMDIDPSLLELEITESAVMHNVEGAIETMQNLRKMGIRLALDDFGTGYSSLHYLKRFPINTLKIDRSFVKDVPGDPDDVAIIQGVISMAKSLHLRVVAEGVETEEQFHFLKKHGCSAMQGFLYSPALAEQDFLAFLDKDKPDV